MQIFLKVLEIVAIVFGGLFLLSLIVYFFNLDMKLSAKIPPILVKHYDKMARNKNI